MPEEFFFNNFIFQCNMLQTQHIFTYLNIFLNIIYLLHFYLYTYLSDCFNFHKIDGGWGGVLSSGKDGTYSMCVASPKYDRPQNDKS